MSRRVSYLITALTIVAAFATQCFAQTSILRIDSSRSVVSLSLVSSTGATPPYNIANAEVMGWVSAAGSDPLKSTFEFFIYPAGQGPNLFDPDGNLKFDSYAELSRYSFLSFKSKRAVSGRDGKLELAGDLILTHVERVATMNASIAYSGPTYNEPETDRLAREVTFVVDTPGQAIKRGFEAGEFNVSAMATIKREDFPQLSTALKDSVWPVLVLNRNCRSPNSGPSMRDYKSFECTGTAVPVEPPPEPPRNFNAAYPGVLSSQPPPEDEVTIVVHLRVFSPH